MGAGLRGFTQALADGESVEVIEQDGPYGREYFLVAGSAAERAAQAEEAHYVFLDRATAEWTLGKLRAEMGMAR